MGPPLDLTTSQAGHDQPIEVFILDDHEVVRLGIAALLDAEADMVVTGQAANGPQAMAVVAATDPDVAIIDVRLPGDSGIKVCRNIRSRYPHSPCLILTSFTDRQALIDAAFAGAAGYVLKQVRGNDLLESIRRVAAGEVLLDEATLKLELSRFAGEDETAAADLTERERSVYELIGHGLSNQEIADQLGLAEKTVRNYVSNLLAKLGMSRRTEVAAQAARTEERQRQRHEL